jgi:hypothetical protein
MFGIGLLTRPTEVNGSGDPKGKRMMITEAQGETSSPARLQGRDRL